MLPVTNEPDTFSHNQGFFSGNRGAGTHTSGQDKTYRKLCNISFHNITMYSQEWKGQHI